ncbi:uncharacterized protein LOC133690222 [Populus nigra]|uniref:uncharacterized protein LOC133690222 n=1 Tax=Populus nigra TaxID=3691 RepID=UPI002B27A57D|nr:uncharacterized protein LOC133690222 [Populus nigra]
MATTASNGAQKREKVTPSSHPHTSTRRQGSSRPASPSSGSTNKDNPSTPSGKPIPNYLKPTFSSRPESLKQVKKTGHEDTSQKPALLRRRSFDKPPSLHHVQKPLLSSDSKERPGRERLIRTARSSSFSSKNVTSPKTVFDRNATSHKPGQSQPLATRITRRSISPSTKKVSNALLLPKEPIRHDVAQNLDLETKQESNAESFLAHESEEILNAVIQEQVPSDWQKVKNKEEPIVSEETEGNNVTEDEKLKGSNITTVAEGEISNDPALAEPVEETETELHQESENRQEEEYNGKLEESIDTNANLEEGIAVEADDQVKVEENANENEVSPEVPVGEEKEGDMNKVNEGSEEHKPQEEQDKVVRNAQEEEKPDDANSPQKKQVVQGIKKESHAAYNDVIEETKNKLLEERKNKVKALVGAFETVIDYESK